MTPPIWKVSTTQQPPAPAACMKKTLMVLVSHFSGCTDPPYLPHQCTQRWLPEGMSGSPGKGHVFIRPIGCGLIRQFVRRNQRGLWPSEFIGRMQVTWGDWGYRVSWDHVRLQLSSFDSVGGLWRRKRVINPYETELCVFCWPLFYESKAFFLHH